LYAFMYEILYVAILHDTRHAPTSARAMISQTGQLALVESGLPNLCSAPAGGAVAWAPEGGALAGPSIPTYRRGGS
jgi:hypothetical protein